MRRAAEEGEKKTKRNDDSRHRTLVLTVTAIVLFVCFLRFVKATSGSTALASSEIVSPISMKARIRSSSEIEKLKQEVEASIKEGGNSASNKQMVDSAVNYNKDCPDELSIC